MRWLFFMVFSYLTLFLSAGCEQPASISKRIPRQASADQDAADNLNWNGKSDKPDAYWIFQ